MAHIDTKVTGTTFQNADGSSRQDILRSMRPQQHVRLQDMSTAQFPEAIGVFNVKGQQLGFLPANVARDIHKRMSDFSSINGRITSIGSAQGSANLGCYIRLSVPDAGLDASPYAQKEVDFKAVRAHIASQGGTYSKVLTSEDVESYQRQSTKAWAQEEKKSSTATIIGYIFAIFAGIALAALIIMMFTMSK